jgi:hypothetical protein
VLLQADKSKKRRSILGDGAIPSPAGQTPTTAGGLVADADGNLEARVELSAFGDEVLLVACDALQFFEY